MTTTPSREDWDKEFIKLFEDGHFRISPDFRDNPSKIASWWSNKLQNHNNALVAEIEKLQKNTKRTEFYGICHSCNSDEKCGCADFNEALDTIIKIIQEK